MMFDVMRIVYDPTWVKCVIISNGIEKVAFITMDVIGADGSMAQLAYDIAASQVSLNKNSSLFLSISPYRKRREEEMMMMMMMREEE